jgi:hypothetical protein
MLTPDDLRRTPHRAVERVACIVHLGAGSGEDVKHQWALGASRVVLVEGDPAAAEELQAVAQHRAEVRHVVVSAYGEVTDWHVLTMPELSGTRRPSERLHRLYPRLKVIGSSAVHTTPIAELLHGLRLAPEESNLLIMDLAGIENELLAAVPEALLQTFEWIELRGCAEPLFEHSAPADAALLRLQTAGFRITLQDLDRRPAWPRYLLRRDRIAIENQDLNKRLCNLTASKEHAEQRAQQAEKQATQAEQSTTDLTKKIQNLSQEIETWRKQCAGLQEELRDARRALNVAVRTQALRENDLRELQVRYGRLLQEHDASQNLLAKLAERLTAAQQYFAQLAPPSAHPSDAPVAVGRTKPRTTGREAQAGSGQPAAPATLQAPEAPRRKPRSNSKEDL